MPMTAPTTLAPLPKLRWVPSPNFSVRTAKVDLVVIHDCESGYQSAINTFQGTGSEVGPVSAHYVLKEDGSEATQMVALDKKAWHCRAYNSRSVGIEMAGFEKRGFSNEEWQASAVMTAYLCHKLHVPVRWASGGVGPGIARHYDLGRAGGGHVDPTLDMGVWNAFIAKVQAAYALHTFPDEWKPDVVAKKR